MLGVEVEKCLERRAAREREEEEEEEEDVVGGEKEDDKGGAAEVGGASVVDVRQTTRREEAVEETTVSEGHENPSRPKGEWARAIGCGEKKRDEVIERWDQWSVVSVQCSPCSRVWSSQGYSCPRMAQLMEAGQGGDR